MCFCSVLSKEQGITAIAVCLTYDIFIARNVSHHNLRMQTQSVMSSCGVRILYARICLQIYIISGGGEPAAYIDINMNATPHSTQQLIYAPSQ
jgi:hypothetical protein